MRPENLRVGNLVFKANQLHAVTADDIVSAHLLTPIKLNGRRLERFGWEEWRERRWRLKDFHVFELQKAMYGAETFQAVRYHNETSHFIVKMHVIYVHELQNLYYFLQDKELKLVK